MNTMSDKPIYRILNALSILALVYYTASSINYLFESDGDVKLPSYERATTSNLSVDQLEAHKAGN